MWTNLALHAEHAFLRSRRFHGELKGILYENQYSNISSKCTLTLGTLVKPDNSHSLTSGGVSTQVAFACSKNGRLIILATNSLVVWIFVAVSLSMLLVLETDKETRGGSSETFKRRYYLSTSNDMS